MNASYDKKTFIGDLEESKVLSDDIIEKISDQLVELKDKKYNWLNNLKENGTGEPKAHDQVELERVGAEL